MLSIACSAVLTNCWAVVLFGRLPIEGRNVMEVMFRLLELGVALWFTCCLWNWKRWEKKETKTITKQTNKQKKTRKKNNRATLCQPSVIISIWNLQYAVTSLSRHQLQTAVNSYLTISHKSDVTVRTLYNNDCIIIQSFFVTSWQLLLYAMFSVDYVLLQMDTNIWTILYNGVKYSINRPFPILLWTYETLNLWKRGFVHSFHSNASKTNFHMQIFALNLAFVPRFKATNPLCKLIIRDKMKHY